MKIFNIIFIILFIISAALQYNDPDPYMWIPIYLYAAYLCFLSIRKIYKPWLYIGGIAIYLGYALYLFFDNQGVISWYADHQAESIVQSMKATKPWIEETREFGGLLICIIALLINVIYYKRQPTTISLNR